MSKIQLLFFPSHNNSNSFGNTSRHSGLHTIEEWTIDLGGLLKLAGKGIVTLVALPSCWADIFLNVVTVCYTCIHSLN